MNFEKYERITEATANAVLDRAGVTPDLLHSNADNTFTAVFNDEPMLEAQKLLKNADKAIQVLMPEPLESDEPMVTPNMTSEVRFGFIVVPDIDLS